MGSYFQYCPKIVLLSSDKNKVLLVKRKGEQDYDGTFSFIGGKTETTDETLVAGLKREKDEEIGFDAKINICWKISCFQVLFRKKSGDSMILPHHVAIYEKGGIIINEGEYSEFKWVPVDELGEFEPKVQNIPEAVNACLKILQILNTEDFELI